MNLPSLDIIIVNWNAGEQLRDCLGSLAETAQINHVIQRVVVVDNASTDQSWLGLEAFKLPLELIRNTENQGFGFACNQGAKHSTADYLLFLNPDTKVFADSLFKPIDFMEATLNQSVGICGVQMIDGAGNVAKTCSRFPSFKTMFAKSIGIKCILPATWQHFMLEWDHNSDRIVDQLMGAFLLIRRNLFEQLNGFDERFFVYQEDVDLAFRAKKLGYLSYFLASTKIYHKANGCSDQVKAKRLFYLLRSRIQYFAKHYNKASALFIILMTICIELPARLLQACLQLSGKKFVETIKGYMYLFQYLLHPQKMGRSK